MTEASISWELWRSFLAVLNDGSLSGAAKSSRLTQPTIGRHIDALEARIGTALFTRSRSGLMPTDRALALRAEAEAMEAAAASLERRASAAVGGTAGTVRITASDAIGTFVLPSIIASLREHHPEVAIELALSDRNANLLTREADVAVRMVRPVQHALIVRPLGAVRLGLFAHRSYLDRAGVPRDVNALATHALIGPDRDLQQMFSLGGRQLQASDFALRCDSDAARVMAIRAGLGVGPCQFGIAAMQEDLQQVLPDEARLSLDMYLAVHEDLSKLPTIRLVFDHLAERLAAYVKAWK